MKLRIRGNSIRLRLTRPEVRMLATAGAVEETTRFDARAAFNYRLETTDLGDRVSAGWWDGRLTVRVPRAFAAAWDQSSQVGIEGTQVIEGHEPLRILIEKDFECLAPSRSENQTGAYANPLSGAACEPSTAAGEAGRKA